MENATKPAAKKLQRAWAMYDWGNSAYNLVITSTIFPAYYIAITTNENAAVSDQVSFFGMQITNTVLQDYTLSLAYLVIAFLSPILSSIADYRGNKKKYMRFFTYMGALACSGLFFFTKEFLELGIILFGIAAIGYCGSLVFYNAFLPEIAPEEDRDRVSAQGFAYGYIGSVILQIICLVFVMKPELFGITDGTLPARISFLLVGLWWMAWAQIPFRALPKGEPLEQHPEHNVFSNGFHELKKVLAQVKQMPVLRTYLSAFFFYSMGVQTVMLAAAAFGAKELGLETGQLITTILIIQLVAIAGAYVMAKLSERFGNINVLIGVVIMWMGICVYAYFIHTATEFYIIATFVGLVMGGIQSLSRSTYSKLMPETKDTASFFSFYDVTEKVAIVIGLFSFGLIEHLTGSMRKSVLAVLVFFVVGGIILYLALRIAKKQNIQASVR
ncbi:MAG: MFS transporter [Chitinophagaceae bacterium]|nr:MFS transporter [Chitinophagaceae bacterium]MCB9045483.1 MFS transporter [Chitinophagales bacterium]